MKKIRILIVLLTGIVTNTVAQVKFLDKSGTLRDSSYYLSNYVNFSNVVSSSAVGIVNNVSGQELGGVDKKINGLTIGKGLGNIVSNSVFGISALSANTTGTDNTAIGYQAMRLATTATKNVVIGANALSNATTTEGNTAVGQFSLNKITTGNFNTAIGTNTGVNLTTNTLNTLIGYRAGENLTSGDRNIMIGYNNVTVGSNNLILGGSQSNPLNFSSATSKSQMIALGNGSGSVRLYVDSLGRTGLNTITPQNMLDVNSPSGGLTLRAGNTGATFNNNQIEFGYQGTTDYSHVIKTRHNNVGLFNNAIDFYVYKFTDPITTKGGQHVMTVEGRGVGIGTTAPTTKLEVASGTAGSSGVRLTNLTNATAGTSTFSRLLGVNATGDVGPAVVLGSSLSGFTDGQITYGNSTGNLAQSANLFYDYTNTRLGIGTSTPTSKIQIPSTETVTALQNYTGNAVNGAAINVYTNSSADNSVTYTRVLDIVSGSTVSGVAGASSIRFLTNTNAEGATNSMGEKMRIHNNGFVGIGTNAPLTRLHVKGVNAQPAASGTTSNATFRVDGDTNHALDMGTFTNSPYGSYIQSVDKTNFGNNLPLSLNPVAGNVGIGTNNPQSKLEVKGSATNSSATDASMSTIIDFSLSNLAYTTANPQLFTLQGIKNGGTYTLAVQGATSGTTTFQSTGFTFRYVNNGTTAAGKHTLYTLLVMGSNVYVYMATGF